MTRRIIKKILKHGPLGRRGGPWYSWGKFKQALMESGAVGFWSFTLELPVKKE